MAIRGTCYGSVFGTLGFSVCVAACSFARTDADSAAKVYLLAGQSNMAGRAFGGDHVSHPADAGIRIDYVCSFSARSSQGGPPDPHRSSGWTRLGPAPKHSGTPASHFGPEIGLGRGLALHLHGQQIVFIKHGRGGTSLAVDWNPKAVTGSRLYYEFIEQSRSALARLRAEGTRYDLEALVWCQGEADSTRLDWAEAYGANLRALFARIREDLAAPRLPILVVLTGDGRSSTKMVHASLIRAAQRKVVGEDTQVLLVSGDDLPMFDGVHYDAPAQLELGRRLAEALRDRSRSLP